MANDMLTGILSQPKKPGGQGNYVGAQAPQMATNPYGGTVPVGSPLQNQTSGGNWWQGQSTPAPPGATSGYGSFNAPPQASTPTIGSTGDGTGDGAVDTTTGSQSQTGQQETGSTGSAKSAKVVQAESMLRNLEGRLLRERQVLNSFQSQGKNTTSIQARINDIMMQMQHYQMIVSRGY